MLALTVGVWRTRPHAKQRSVFAQTGPPGISFPTLNLYVYAGGSKQWTLTAVNASISDDQRFIRSQSIRNGRFYQDGQVAGRFTAGPATYDKTTNDLDLGGPIRVNAANGAALRCGSLHYLFATRRLAVEGPLTFTNGKSTFTAGRLDADLSLSELTFGATPGQPVTLSTRT